MNQAQALSSVSYRILRTISLNQHFYIMDIACSSRGTVCLSFTSVSYDTCSFINGTKDVKLAIPTGSYIDMSHCTYTVQNNLFLVLNDTVNMVSSYEDYCRLSTLKPLEADERPLKAHGIAVCKSGDILVCLWNRKFKERSAGKVVKLLNGQHLILEIESEKNIPLYLCPTYIAENDNGDICVSDARAVVVTDAGGMLRFRYQGNSSSNNFDPYGICCDSKSNIIVADMKNDKIYAIDKDGAFLHYVTYDGIKMPRAICIDENDNLYVGEWHTDTIKVIAR